MAMGSTGGGEGLSSDINVTPLIDVLLVLLIIFMITQPMSRKAFDVQVPPKQQTKSKAQNQAQIVLELRPDGSYAINGQPQELRLPLGRRRLGPGATLAVFVHAVIVGVLVVGGREIVGRGQGESRAGGGDARVNFFAIPAGAPAAVDMALPARLTPSELSALRR